MPLSEAVLSADPLTVPEENLADITAIMTAAGGRVVHDAPPWHGQPMR